MSSKNDLAGAYMQGWYEEVDGNPSALLTSPELQSFYALGRAAGQKALDGAEETASRLAHVYSSQLKLPFPLTPEQTADLFGAEIRGQRLLPFPACVLVGQGGI